MDEAKLKKQREAREAEEFRRMLAEGRRMQKFYGIMFKSIADRGGALTRSMGG
ncbi:MAG: hypothetical protein N3E51_04715 [Candidatus Micrarchaeota archaeon]|nr:hypothetical protein [Candidatus Micrarchaeota archaeon]